MLGLTATTGKIGGATLDAIVEHQLVPLSESVILSSSSPSHEKFTSSKLSGVKVLQTNYDDPSGMTKAIKEAGIDRLFLVSTPAIAMDFNDAPLGKGREKQHFAAIDAAVQGSVKHLYYTSLAFQDGSQAGVMRAHFRTEEYLQKLQREGKLDYTIIRMGLYNESWPLYLGHYNVKEGGERRSEIVIAGDGPISWTSISDLGLATALILSRKGNEADKYTNQTFFLSQSESHTLEQVCSMVDSSKSVKVVSTSEYVDYYTEELKMDKAMLEWWCTTYPSVFSKMCEIQDTTFEQLLATKGKKPDSIQSTIDSMVHAT